MKIGKQPKRWGKPSDKFLAKKQAEETVRANIVFPKDATKREIETIVAREAANLPDQTDPASIKLYMDDERSCPPGWTLCRTAREFIEHLERPSSYLDRITHISLDWYLGDKSPLTGYEVSQRLAEFFLDAYWDERVFLPNLKAIGFHSSDPDQAKRMAKEVSDSLSHVKRDGSIRLRLGTPSL